MFIARTIFLLTAFPILLNAQKDLHPSCELNVSVRDGNGKPVQANLTLTSTDAFMRTLATDRFGVATFLDLPAATFTLAVRVGARRETAEDVSTDGPDCQKFELVRVTATDSVGNSEVFVGDLDAPKSAKLLYRRAIQNLHRQHWRDAESELEQAVHIHPAYARAYDALGVAATENGHFAEADKAFQDAIKLRKNYPEAYLNFARFLIRRQREPEADTVLNHLLSFSQENPVGESLLARCLFDERKYAELVAFIQKIHVQHLTHEALVHEFVAEFYRRQGMIQEYRVERATYASESGIHP